VHPAITYGHGFEVLSLEESKAVFQYFVISLEASGHYVQLQILNEEDTHYSFLEDQCQLSRRGKSQEEEKVTKRREGKGRASLTELTYIYTGTSTELKTESVRRPFQTSSFCRHLDCCITVNPFRGTKKAYWIKA
jgi:hypothetical protein